MGVTQALLSEQEMIDLLTLRRETANQDYRRELPPRGHKNCAVLDLLKDLVAMANVGGGVIVFGVEDDNYELVGLTGPRKQKPLEEQDIARAFKTYLDAELRFELTTYRYRGKDFVFLAIGGSELPPIFRKPAMCEICGDKAALRHFPLGSTFIRQGASTVRASDAWIMGRVRDAKLVDAVTIGTNALMNNLPSRHSIYDTFVGRQGPFEDAVRLLEDERRRISWIQGSGGIGKTALAYRIAEHVVGGEVLAGRIDYVVWISAKETALTLSGLVSQEPALTKVADIARATADVTGMVDVTTDQLSQIHTAGEAINALGSVLTDLTGLLVLDNLETVHDNEVLKLLYQLPGHTRALATTRQSMDPSKIETILLEPMSLTEAETLIKNEAMRTGRGWLTVDDDAITDIVSLSGRIPLAIRLIVPVVESRKSLRNYQAAAPKHQKDLLDFCYLQTFDELNNTERRLFFALSLFDDGATVADLAYVLGVDLNDVIAHETLLRQLEKLLHLSIAVIRTIGVNAWYQMQALVRRFAARRLATDAGLKHDLKLRLSLLEVRKAGDLRANAQKAIDTYKETGHYEDAIAILDECLKRESRSADAWLARAEIEILHGRHANRAAAAAIEVRALAERGSLGWRKATEIVAEVEMQSEQPDYRKIIELLCEIDEKSAEFGVLFLMGEAYYRIAGGIRSENVDEVKRAKHNYSAAADYARRAARRCHGREARADLARALSLWARAALPFNPAVAYQAAERALGVGSAAAPSLKEIMHKASLELKATPSRDLLGIDE